MLGSVKATFIGSGAMGEAMIRVILERGLIEPARVTATDIRADRRAELAGRYDIGVDGDNAAAVAGADIVVLSIKPQALSAVIDDLGGAIPPQALVLSIVTGAKLSALVEGLGHAAVIRAMPNTPAQIGQGMTVWTATAAISGEQRVRAEAILDAMGQALYVDDEKYLDMATALMGSGPAYVFLFMEAMVDAGVYLGFSRAVAKQLVLQTVVGSSLYAAESGAHLAELRNMVTSPGGTTVEALYAMEKGALRGVICEAIVAAYEKSVQLGS
jgi:pyrroline-5-carboxylate reductase